MLSNELRAIRVKSGFNQSDFSKVLNCCQVTLSKMERGELPIPSKITDILDNLVDKETRTTLTKKVFSRDLFLKDMLTGNELVDNIYNNAQWIKDLDNSPIHAKGTRVILKADNSRFIHRRARRLSNFKKNPTDVKIRDWEKQYVILGLAQAFYCKEEWLR